MSVRSDLYSEMTSSTAEGAGAGGREDVELMGEAGGFSFPKSFLARLLSWHLWL